MIRNLSHVLAYMFVNTPLLAIQSSSSVAFWILYVVLKISLYFFCPHRPENTIVLDQMKWLPVNQIFWTGCRSTFTVSTNWMLQKATSKHLQTKVYSVYLGKNCLGWITKQSATIKRLTLKGLWVISWSEAHFVTLSLVTSATFTACYVYIATEFIHTTVQG